MKILFIIPFLLFSLLVSAQTITWNGGVGDWHNPNNWTPNQVPNASDWVLINGNNTIVYIEENTIANASRVEISSNSELSNSGHLQIVSSAFGGIVLGMQNSGYLRNSGTVSIQSSTTGVGEAYQGGSSSTLGNKSSGDITMGGFNIGLKLLGNTSSNSDATVYNEGHISFNNITTQSIFFLSGGHIDNHGGVFDFANTFIGVLLGSSRSKFVNSGELNFNTNISSRSLEISGGQLENLSGGTIDVQSGGMFASSIQVFANGNLINGGHISIRSGRVLGITDGSMHNQAGSTLDIDATTGSGAMLMTGATAEFVNEGLIETRTVSNSSAIGILNQSHLRNLKGGVIKIRGNGNVAVSLNGATFTNAGLLRVFASMGSDAIIFSGNNPTLLNNSCGLIDLLSGALQMPSSDGLIQNQAVIYLKDPTANHVIDGQLNNTAIITDPFDRLPNTNINNFGLITNSLQGPLTAGTAIPNALRLGSTVNIGSIIWRLNRNGPSAGSYSLGTNTYIPNASAVGDGLLWVRVRLRGCGYRYLRIPVQNPTPLQSTGPSVKPNEAIGFNINPGPEEWVIFPNPAVSDLTLTYSGSQNKDLTLELWNTTGQLISRQHFSAEAGHVLQIERPHSAKAGTYRLRIISEEGESIVKTIVWQ